MAVSADNQGKKAVRHVFIIGSKGIPAAYGGFETFVDKLTEYRTDDAVQYHVACRGTSEGTFLYNGAECFTVRVRGTKPYMAVFYDLSALKYVISYLRAHRDIKDAVVYILACRIGPFIAPYAKEIRKLGGVIYVNPDGHEWKREKWSLPVKRYWKYSEGLMVKNADLMICDSRSIEQYIRREYAAYHPETVYIAYGSETSGSRLPDDDPLYRGWLKKNGLRRDMYYLIVGRFVPENNFETMLREFMKCGTERKLAVMCTPNPPLLEKLEKMLGFRADGRIVFTGSEYNQVLVRKIREGAFAYIHGHSVGGTNPSLLEALGATEVSLLFDVGFNREVAKDAALYWNKSEGNLSALLDRVDGMSREERMKLGEKAKKRIRTAYSWEYITEQYERLFLGKHS